MIYPWRMHWVLNRELPGRRLVFYYGLNLSPIRYTSRTTPSDTAHDGADGSRHVSDDRAARLRVLLAPPSSTTHPFNVTQALKLFIVAIALVHNLGSGTLLHCSVLRRFPRLVFHGQDGGGAGVAETGCHEPIRISIEISPPQGILHPVMILLSAI